MHRVNFNVPTAEKDILEGYCSRTGRSKTDVFREFIRSLSVSQESRVITQLLNAVASGNTPEEV